MDNRIITLKETEQFARNQGIDEIEILNEENDILVEENVILRDKLTVTRIACAILAIAFIATWLIILLV